MCQVVRILGDSFGPCWAHSFVGPCWAHSFSVISHENDILFCFYLEGRFLFYFRIMSNPPQKAICSSRNKSQMAQNEKVPFHGKLRLRLKAQSKSNVFDRESQVVEENIKERGSIDEHFALGGWA